MDAKQIKFSTSTGTSSLLTNLILYYKLDEPSGTTVDDATGIQDATTNATVSSTGGIIGGSETFDGSTDCIDAPYNASQTLSGTSCSVSCWVYITTLPSSASHEAYLIRGTKGEDPWETVYLTVGTDNVVYFHVKNSDGTPVDYEVASSGTLSASTWYHIVGICPGASQALKLYINGSDVSTGAETFTGTINSNTGGWAFGDAYSGGGSGLIGELDEVGIWSKGLSGSEVTELYNSGAGKTHPFS